jgi:hypothetical protein
MNFECSICCESFTENSRNKKIECVCGCVVCNHCQKTYAKALCMNCKAHIPKDKIENLLGKTFVKSVIEKSKIDELIQEEKELMAATDELIKFHEKEREDRDLLRKGMVKSLMQNTRPIIRGKIRSEYCTVTGCKGLLKMDINTKKYECIICKKTHCVHCLCEKEKDKEHVCDKNILETLKNLDEETKKCPKCATRIYKTEGCDHMNCTNCNTHFSWTTGIIQDYGYNPNRPFRNDDGTCHINYDDEQIPRDVMNGLPFAVPEKIMNLLYDETNLIRKYLKKECDYNKILTAYYMANDDLRVKYMKGELNEAQWGRFLYMKYKSMKLKVNYREVIEMYLTGINGIQSSMFNEVKKLQFGEEELYFESIYKSIIELMKRCNECFDKINDEFYCENVVTQYKFNIPEDSEKNDDYLIISKSSVKTEKKSRAVKKKKVEDQQVGQNMTGEDKNSTEIDNLLDSIIENKGYTGIEEGEEGEDDEEKDYEIKLFEYQHPHFEKIYNILLEHNFALDLSPLGTGKTYISGKYIEINDHFKHVYIICPASLRAKWSDVVKTHQLNKNRVVEIYSYNEVAGQKMVHPKHGLLLRNDFKTMRMIAGQNEEIEMASFRISEKYKEYYNKGEFLFIFDEIQNIRNGTSYTTNACREMMKHILNNKHGNKMICISGTPFDKIEQIITFYRNVGIQTHDELVTHNWHTGVNTYKGYAEIIDYCKKIDVDNLNSVYYNEIKTNPYMSAERCKSRGYQLFLTTILKHLSSHMKMIEKNKHKITNINAFYPLSPEFDKICLAAINRILALMNDDGSIVDHQKRVNVFKALPILEAAKMEIFEAEATRALQESPNHKIVCVLNYTDNIDDLMKRLEAFKPQRLDGSVNTNKRADIIRKFQEPNNECRLLICNITVVATGIDLDDKNGAYPRKVFVSPTYKIIDMNQLSFRFLRSLDTKSDTLIKYIYTLHSVKKEDLKKAREYFLEHPDEKDIVIPVQNESIHGGTEMRILYHLSKKANVMKSISKEEVEFPCDFHCKLIFN